ncbi:MAG TPA: hypothetical protein VLJ44_07020 [Gaiellaceae bacterium]|nr:hypothetical protein [Gaiellaceae bacterium]
MRHLKLAQGTALVAMAIAVSVVVLLGLIAARPGRANQQCTHGVSSIGPVFIKDGKVVGGDTTPHTEACLP